MSGGSFRTDPPPKFCLRDFLVKRTALSFLFVQIGISPNIRNMHMKSIFIFFVSAPAWTIFSLFILPFVLLAIGPMTTTAIHATQIVPLIKILLLISIWSVLLWIYSIGVLLLEKYAQHLNIPIDRFKFCLIYVVLYSILFLSDVIPFDYLMIFNFISMGCNIYVLYFVSKLIVLIERKTEIKFQDCIGTFFCVWFYLIGIWFIQPRINKLYLSNDSDL